MQKEYFLGIDLGGTNKKAVLLDSDFKVLEEQSVATNDNGLNEGISWKNSVKELLSTFQEKADNSIKIVGLSAPGLANEFNTAIAFLPQKLIGLENFIWQDFLGIETYVLNDAHAALMAESRLGAGRDYPNSILITLGTGVGGAVMLEGKLLQGKKGRAGHFGHISLNQGIDQSIVNAPGSLENAIGECTISKRTYGRYNSTEELVKAYQEGEPFATWVWLNSVQQLSRGIVSLINSFSPGIVILGGGISRAGEALIKPLNDFLAVYEWRPAGFQTPVCLAEMGGNAGAIGAALFAKEKSRLQHEPNT